MPGYLLATYALLLLSLGWFAHQRWIERPTSVVPPTSTVQPHSETPPSENTPPLAQAVPATPASAPKADPSPPPTAAPKPAKVEKGQVPPLTYSAHVFTSDPSRRSVTLNGVRYQEGESPMEGLVIEQIQQDITLFDANGEIFILDALSDWPGGDIKEVGAE
ncbi:type II secretion system assembly factor GspB [Candidatus Symbiopectobacterium sp. 'North America']|uniref:type II secretion system assembly factor GspB n=1 Tax=Candidatus Symbiopectobacterium sp. 'North America' TaxID=2794574 RepID=UPI00245375E4|nr:type II secretion system assembly factor GspB [Candidatus Symbiopectobacterium sp. 'North America']